MTIVLQTIVLIISLATAMWAMLKFMLRDIHKDLNDLKESNKRHENRIDQLYQMFLSLQKETKEMFYDLIKDKKSSKKSD